MTSMPSGVFDSILLKHVWGTQALRAVFNDENRVQKWFDFEAALALAQAELGIIPQAAAGAAARPARPPRPAPGLPGATDQRATAPPAVEDQIAAERLCGSSRV